MHCIARKVLLTLCAVVATSGHAFAADYALKQKFTIGGEGGWDYLTYDAHANRLFISRGTHVQVVDPGTGSVLGDIPETPGVHGIAPADDLGKGYTSNGRDNSVTVFELRSLKTIARIRLEGAKNPDFILYDAASRRVFAFNGRSRNASVIDAETDKPVATIALSGKPEAAAADGRGGVFVNIEDADALSVIDARNAVVLRSWPLAGCHEPAGLAIDPQTRRLFVGCHNKALLVVDAENGKAVASLPIGEGVDANAFDAQTGLGFSSQGDGSLTVIREEAADKFSVVQNAVTQRGARTMALNPKTHDVYLVTAEIEETAVPEGRPRRTLKPGTFTLLVFGVK